MRYSLIKNGKVENIIEAEPEFVQLIMNEWDEIIENAGAKGQLWDGQNFSDPPQEIVVNYKLFWDFFKKSELYTQFRIASTQNLSINTTLTELIIEINNSYSGIADEERIQQLLDQLVIDLNSNQEILSVLEQYLSVGNLNTKYTLNY